MPPDIGRRIWNGLVSSFTGGSKDSEGVHDSTPPNQDPTCDNSDIEEVSGPSTKKRKVVAGVQISRKRPDTRSENERRLTGDYDNPPDAVPIGMPQRPQESESAQVEELRRAGTMSRMARSKPGAGAGVFRPQNSLANPSAQAARSMTVTGPGFMGRKATGFVGKGVNGDAFHGSEREPAAKNRKTEAQQHQKTLNWELEQDRIEDPDDDDAVDVQIVTGVNGKPPPRNRQNDRTQSMVRSESQSAPFEANEFKKIDQTLNPAQPKRRRAANCKGSNQGSSRASPVVMTNGHSGRTAAEAVPIDDDTSQEISQHHAQAPPPSSSGSLPDPKAIMNGVNEASHAKQRRHSGNSVELTHTKIKSQMPPPAAKKGDEHAVQPLDGQLRRRRKIEQDGDPAPKNDVTGDALRYKERRPSEEENTRDKFRRAVPPSQQPANYTTSRKAQMKADSGRAVVSIVSGRDSSGSADELTGPTNVGSVSPEKKQPQTTETRSHVNGSRSSRSGSPSDLRPTAFTENRRTRKSGHEQTAKQSRRPDEEDERHEIPLSNFYATSCVLREGKITMKYDPRQNELDIYHNDELQVVREEQCNVHISRKEVSSIVWSKGSRFILLKGPRTTKGVSNGYICFTLADVDDKRWLAIHITAVVGDSLTQIPEPTDRMKNTFDLQATALFKLYERRAAMAAHEASMQKSVSRQRAARKSRDADQIRYEDDEPTRPNRRKGMLGDTMVDDDETSPRPQSSEAYEHSRYFADSALRRSARQTKPIRKTTPTPPPPPKWTQEHRPERWPHSVVYPNEGARRVTVDFQDLERLDEGEFLNDNVISFALRRIEEKMAPEHKERVHFFNSFFYTALTTKNGKKDFNYDAVKRWTKSKDLLGCDYVVVPINIDLHWFVAIICNLPNLSRRIAADEEEDATKSEEQLAEEGQEAPSDPIDASAAAEGEQSARQTPENTKGMRNLSLSDDEGTSKTLQPEDTGGVADVGGAHAPEDAETPLSAQKAATAAGRKGKKRGPPSFNPENPSIITLDSFGSAHTTEVKNLKDYISEEAKAKRGIEVDRSQLQGANIRGAGIPTQSNFCDCGVYLVGYVEQFAKDPTEFATKALTRKLGQESEFEGFDPSQKRDEIRDELLKLQKEQEAEHKAKKAGKKAAAPKTDGQAAASAAATPKPESKPASKAASPVRDTGKEDAAPPLPPRQQATTSWAPAEATETAALPGVSQTDELDYEPPRALQSPSRHVGADLQPAQPFQEDSSQEMLDEPRHHDIPDQAPADEPSEPNELLDTLDDAVRRNTQPVELTFDEQLQEAASKDIQDVQADQGDEPDEGPEMIENKDVIDLGDSDDERNRSAEIPDSQERRQASARWAGTRTILD